ncbi:unnamed protein product [Cuscuta epithymum]|uniref:C2H2-type domain-containing protein n=1 Tax=Cuscuta epithymum TaxID=186058 RepID=A0AAV0CAQ5_9ASTE|nr:unnamed protein product [Cuscuta epithymum]
MEANNTTGGEDELDLRWTWQDIFGPSPANTPLPMEGCEVATEGGIHDHEDAMEEGVEHTPAATEGDDGAADGKTVEGDQGRWLYSIVSSWLLSGCVMKLNKQHTDKFLCGCVMWFLYVFRCEFSDHMRTHYEVHRLV